MEEITIIHNPRCSKSRQTLELLKEKGIEPKVRLYLQDTLSEDEIRKIVNKLNLKDAVRLIRNKEQEYKDYVVSCGVPNNVQAIKLMAQHPKIIERPIVINGEKAAIGRPPEKVLEIL